MGRKSVFAVTCVAVAWVLSGILFAGEEGTASLKLRHVSLFKNGIGYFSSETKLPDGATTVNLGQLPVPSHGTLWVYYPRDVKMEGLFTKLVEVEKEVPAANMLEMLRINAGTPVEIMTSLKDMETMKVTVLSVGEPELPPEPPSPYVMGIRPAGNNRYRGSVYNPYNVSVLLVKTENHGIIALNSGSIIGAKFVGGKPTVKRKYKQKQASVRLELGEPAGGKEITVNYLARGITWVPSYQIDLSDPEKARLSAKALVINEVADLKGVAIDFVTGFPHIKFADVNSPMAMTQDLAGFLQALVSGQSTANRNRGYMTQQRAMMNAPVYARAEVPIAGYSTARKGTSAEDLFFYPVDSITLLKGETAYVPLFTAELDYNHIYTWQIPDVLDENERYNRQREQDQQKLGEEVWHSCRMKNSMSMPWTTAAAEFVKDGQFIGQDVCYYTASGVETTIRITRAMNLIAEKTEFEVKRERNAGSFHGYRYDLVTLEGELKVFNKTDKKVNMEIKKDLSGELLNTSHDAKDVKLAKGLKKVNPRHTLTWNINLDPGKEEKLTYKYTVYIRG